MTYLTTGRGLDKSEYEFYISEIVEKIAQEEEIPEELVEGVKDKLSFKEGLIGINTLLPEIKKYLNENGNINFDNIKNKITSRGVLRMSGKMEGNLENDIKTILEKLYNESLNNRLNEGCTKLIKELIINITILEGYKALQKRQQEIHEKKEQITKTTKREIGNL